MAAPPTGAFDAFHPPSAERIADCVHCGFCLPACPTYQLWGEEADSPRGRIWLMQLGLEGEVSLDEEVVGHFDACLGCMACVTACPSGVRYDELIEATRAQVERNHRRSLGDRLFRAAIFALFPHPRRLRAAAAAGWVYQRLRGPTAVRRLGLSRRLPPRLRALEELLPDVRLRDLRAGLPPRVPAQGSRRLTVGLLSGCVQSVYFPGVNAATARVLAAEGCEVVVPRGQRCCGALAVHSGRHDLAVAAARETVDAFDAAGVDVVVVNAAGCGSTLKEYDRLLADDPAYAERAAALAGKARDVTEVLADLPPRAPRHPVRARVAYPDACHLAHAQGVRAQPRAVLSGVPELELLEVPGGDLCCGSAGVYNLVEPEPAAELGRRKAANIRSTGAQAVVTGNPGCLLQLRRELDLPLRHPVEVLDAAIRGSDPFQPPSATRPRRKKTTRSLR